MKNSNYSDPNDVLKEIVTKEIYKELEEDIEEGGTQYVLNLFFDYDKNLNNFNLLSPVDNEFKDFCCKKCKSEKFRLGYDGFYFIVKCDNCKYEIIIT